MAEVSDAQLENLIRETIAKVDLDRMGLKKLTKMLSKEVGYDLMARKPFIKKVVTDAINEMESEEEEVEEAAQSPRKKKGGGGGGLTAKKEISAELASFMQVEAGTTMARTEIVKKMWEYIREHNLQNPENKTQIFLDEDMKAVFGCDTFTMFSMNKYIGAHVHPFKPVDLTTNSSTPSKRKRKSKAKDGSEKKKRKSSNQPTHLLSEDLAAVVGTQVLSRPQVVKKLWEYIRAKDLQNPTDKREILCDELLKAVMKRSKVTMFKMNSLLSPHFLERVETTPADDDAEEE